MPRSLSSLLFLSMGIFLLNSVNKLVNVGSSSGPVSGSSSSYGKPAII